MVLVWPTSEFWHHAGTLIGATYLFLCYILPQNGGGGGGGRSASPLEDNVKKAAIWTRRLILFWYTTISESYKFGLSTCRCQTKQHHMNIQTFIAEISWKSNKGVVRSLKRGKVHKIYQYIVISMYLTRSFNLFCYMDLKSGDSLISFSIIHRIYMKFWI